MGTGEEGVPRRWAEVFKGLEEKKCLSLSAVGTVGGREGGRAGPGDDGRESLKRMASEMESCGAILAGLGNSGKQGGGGGRGVEGQGEVEQDESSVEGHRSVGGGLQLEAGVGIFQKERLPRERAMAQWWGGVYGARPGESECSLLNTKHPGQGYHLHAHEPTGVPFSSLATPRRQLLS